MACLIGRLARMLYNPEHTRGNRVVLTCECREIAQERLPDSPCYAGAWQTGGPESPRAHRGEVGLQANCSKHLPPFAEGFPLGSFRNHGIDTADCDVFSTARCGRAIVLDFWTLPKLSAMDRLFLHRLDGHSQGQAGASDFGSALAIAEPSLNRHDRNFRGIWAQSKPGIRFERKRLMRMNHRLPSEDSR